MNELITTAIQDIQNALAEKVQRLSNTDCIVVNDGVELAQVNKGE